MAKTDNLADFLKGLADKFRSKLGGTALINPQSFESKIDEVYQKGYDDAPKGTDVSDTTATAADVLQGKIFYGADGVSQKGTIVEQSSLLMNYSSRIPWQRPLVEFKPAENGYITTDSSLRVLETNLANGIELTADKILKGKKVLYLDGTATSDATATAADILSGKTAYVNGVKLTGTAQTGVDVSDTTATAADVVSGKVFYGADGTKQTGEVYVMDRLAGRITNYGGTISGGSVTDRNGTIGFYSDPYGFPLYLKDTGGFSVEAPYSVVAQAIGLTGDKIVSGNTILGVQGTAATGVDTSDATATAADILSGKTAYVNGVKLTGTAPQVECGSFTPTATTGVEGYTINVNKQPQQLIIYLNPTNETYQSYRLIYILDWNVNKGFITYSSTTKKVTLSDLAVYSNGVVTLSDVDGVRDTRYFYKGCEYHYIIKY